MFRRRLVWLSLLLLLAPVSAALAAAGPASAPASGAAASRSTGIHGKTVLLGGRAVGRVVESEINCVGHAAGVGNAVYVEHASLEEMLAGLGYSCRVGDSDTLRDAIAAGRPVMMVYLHLYPADWRQEADRDLTYAELVARFGWTEDAWRDPYAFFDRDGTSLPLDYHAVGFSQASGRWEWVTRARDKNPDGGYHLDSHPFEPAAGDPDLYFPAERVLVSLACQQAP